MKTLLLLLVLIACAALVGFALIKRKRAESNAPASNEPWPYQPRLVVTKTEQPLYHRLREAAPKMEVLAQVGLSRVIETKGGNGNGWFKKINQKTVDFVVCAPDFRPLLVIELDDSSHNRNSRRKADADKDKALNDAGLTVLRWKVGSLPSLEEIRAEIAKAMLASANKPTLQKAAT